jgi:hypothetical protein
MIQRARRARVSSPSARCVHSMMERCEDRHRATWSRRAEDRSVWTAGLRERFRFGFDNPASRNGNWAMLRAGFTPEETAKIVGGNYMRIFNAALT